MFSTRMTVHRMPWRTWSWLARDFAKDCQLGSPNPLTSLSMPTELKRKSASSAAASLERRVADAMVEADPIDAATTARGIAIAQLHPPLRRLAIGDISQGALHGGALPLHAACLPLAVDPDIQRNRIVEHRPGRTRR